MLTEANLLPGPNQTFWNMAKERILYVGRKKPKPCPKRWRGQVVGVLHCKVGVANDGTKNVMLLK